MKVLTRASLKCPECGVVQDAEMPTDACQFFYDCASCRALLWPKAGDCCVFCSYADVPCPSKQLEAAPYVTPRWLCTKSHIFSIRLSPWICARPACGGPPSLRQAQGRL
ncbi:MAG: hypothetical protein EXR60_05705 [Dehalococcoidia bacterium]|nr:hypothetical protein [Dehalococcoidia bacterium]